MIRFLCVVFALAYLASIVAADGYQYRAGYYYYNNEPQAYYRSLVTTPGYWSYGRYYPGYSQYYYYYAYTPPVAPATPQANVDWRSRLLTIAGEKVKYEAQVQKEILEQASYMEAIKALGLEGALRSSGYSGTIPSYLSQGYTVDGHHYKNSYLYGANASTVYGYNASAALYNENLLPQLYQMASQHTVNSQALTDKAQVGFQALVGQEGTNRAKVAELLAKKEMVVAMLKALEGPPSALTQGFSFKLTPQGLKTDSSQVDPGVKEKLFQQFQGLVTAKCAKCHSTAAGTTKDGGLDIFTYPTLTPEQKQIIWDRLTTNDKDKLMPKNGPRLTPEELRLFALN